MNRHKEENAVNMLHVAQMCQISDKLKRSDKVLLDSATVTSENRHKYISYLYMPYFEISHGAGVTSFQLDARSYSVSFLHHDTSMVSVGITTTYNTSSNAGFNLDDEYRLNRSHA